jgi:voltage-gated potassium channel
VVLFLIDVLLLARTIGRGIYRDPEFRAIAILMFLLLSGGTLFYWRVEQWTIVDSLYFCVMTISTVGYGDLIPHGDLSKLFTIGFTIFGIGLFASFVGKLVGLRIELHRTAIKAHHHGKPE